MRLLKIPTIISTKPTIQQNEVEWHLKDIKHTNTQKLSTAILIEVVMLKLHNNAFGPKGRMDKLDKR